MIDYDDNVYGLFENIIDPNEVNEVKVDGEGFLLYLQLSLVGNKIAFMSDLDFD